MPITWRNVAAPDISDSLRALRGAQQSFGAGLGAFQDLAQQQRQANIAADQQQQAGNLQAFREALVSATPTEQAAQQLDFGQLAGQFDLNAGNRALAFEMSQNRDDVLRQEHADQLNLQKAEQGLKSTELQQQQTKLGITKTQNEITQQAEQLEIDDQVSAGMSDYMGFIAQQGNQATGQYKSARMAEITKGMSPKAASQFQANVARYDADLNKLTVSQQEHLNAAQQAAATEKAAVEAGFNNQLATAKSQFPYDPNLTPKQTVKAYADTFKYMNQVAPAQGWYPSWDSREGAEGQELQDVVQEDLEAAQVAIRNQPGVPKDYRIPPEALQMAVESMPVGDDQEMATTNLQARIVEYAQLLRQNELNKAQMSKITADVTKSKLEYDQKYNAEIAGLPSKIRKLY